MEEFDGVQPDKMAADKYLRDRGLVQSYPNLLQSYRAEVQEILWAYYFTTEKPTIHKIAENLGVTEEVVVEVARLHVEIIRQRQMLSDVIDEDGQLIADNLTDGSV